MSGAVVLIGLSGTGKSSVGRLLAARLDLPFVDTDDMVAARAGKPVPLVFAEEGEDRFRDMETAAVEEAARLAPCVVATGGGAVLRPRNREALLAGNLVVWLDAIPADLARRLRGHVATPDERPLLRGDLESRLAAMVAERGPIYSTCAAVRIDTSHLDMEGVARAVLEAVEGWREGGQDG